MKYSLLILKKEIPYLNVTELVTLEPTGTETTSKANTSDVGNLTRELDDGNLKTGTWRRELEDGNLTTGTDDRNWRRELDDGNWRRELTSVGPSGSEVKLELKKWPVLLRIGLLKYPGGWSFHPILRFCFSRTRLLWYFLISINFISCQFTSFFFE